MQSIFLVLSFVDCLGYPTEHATAFDEQNSGILTLLYSYI